MAATLNGTGVTFSDGTNLNSASTANAIGMFGWFFRSVNSNLAANNTVSGSNLFYPSAVGTQNGIVPGPNNARVDGNRLNASAQFSYGAGVTAMTFTPTTGTWRALCGVNQSSYDGCSLSTNMQGGLYVRVS